MGKESQVMKQIVECYLNLYESLNYLMFDGAILSWCGPGGREVRWEQYEDILSS